MRCIPRQNEGILLRVGYDVQLPFEFCDARIIRSRSRDQVGQHALDTLYQRMRVREDPSVILGHDLSVSLCPE
jgi:hypothetical protein